MKNDQILYVNRQNLTGKSNQEALDILRRALSSPNDDNNDSKIRLVVARTISGMSGSSRPTMAVLGEKPEEVREILEVQYRYYILYSWKI